MTLYHQQFSKRHHEWTQRDEHGQVVATAKIFRLNGGKWRVVLGDRSTEHETRKTAFNHALRLLNRERTSA